MAREFLITFPGGARVDAQYGDMVVRTDQPVRAGGEASAPSPFDLFLASMGTCAGIYVLSFCQQRGVSAEDVHLTQVVETDPATHLVSAVRLTIHVPADFPKKYEAALIRSAELCAVKRALESPPAITVETQFG